MDSWTESHTRRPGFLPRIEATRTTAVLLGAIWGAMVLTGVDAMNPSTLALVDWGANHWTLSLVDEPWRLVTAGFLHGGLVHLVFNVMVLLSLVFTEQVFGRVTWIVVFLVAVVTGNLASAAAHGPVSVGASGGVFGLFGAALALAVAPRSRTGLPPEARRALGSSIVKVLALNVLFALVVKNLDHRAHAGGLVGGFLVAFAAVSPMGAPGRTRRAWIVGALAIAALGGAFLVLRPSAAERESLGSSKAAEAALTTLRGVRDTLREVEAQLRGSAPLPDGVEARLDRALRDLEATEAAFARYGAAHGLRIEVSPDATRAALARQMRESLALAVREVVKRRATTLPGR